MENKTLNELVPGAACPRCGGWTSFGGMSQYSESNDAVMGRIGCVCYVAQSRKAVIDNLLELEGFRRDLIKSHLTMIETVLG